MKLTKIGWVALILVLIGSLNWGLIGFFNVNVVAAIFGETSTIARIIYAIIGICALYIIFNFQNKDRVKKGPKTGGTGSNSTTDTNNVPPGM